MIITRIEFHQSEYITLIAASWSVGILHPMYCNAPTCIHWDNINIALLISQMGDYYIPCMGMN